mmetsp:Transcript_21037/g.49960  ORF Transcript_21037/g.49960 Transcript_21037/m.49960 type:complete len:336 (-) Transcript_21037:346-1353(-)
MSSSVCRSTLAVASSITITLDCRSNARARHSNCRSPTLRLPPPVATASPSAPGSARMVSSIRTCWSASHTSSSLKLPKGSRLERMVPEKRTGSCGMIESFILRSLTPIVEMSTPSIDTLPDTSCAIRNRHTATEDLPAPVRPTNPIFSAPLISKLRSLSAGSRPSLYAITTFSKTNFPLCGHSFDGRASGMMSAGSEGRFPYSVTLSAATRLVSMLTICCSSSRVVSASSSARDILSPAVAALPTPSAAITAATAVAETTMDPRHSMRTLSQFIAPTKPNIARIQLSARWHPRSRITVCCPNARIVSSPLSVSVKCANIGDRVWASNLRIWTQPF